MLYGFLLAAILSAAEFASESVAERIRGIHSRMVSLNAGIMLSFLLLVVFPELFENAGTGKTVFVAFFLGVLAYQLGERFVYRHSKGAQKLRHELALVHLAGFYITGIIEGMALFFS